jgi:hypothetical protein
VVILKFTLLGQVLAHRPICEIISDVQQGNHLPIISSTAQAEVNMKKYRVALHYEHGSVLEVEADSKEAADEAVLRWAEGEARIGDPTPSEQVEYKGGGSLEAVHRDYLVCDVEEQQYKYE